MFTFASISAFGRCERTLSTTVVATESLLLLTWINRLLLRSITPWAHVSLYRNYPHAPQSSALNGTLVTLVDLNHKSTNKVLFFLQNDSRTFEFG